MLLTFLRYFYEASSKGNALAKQQLGFHKLSQGIHADSDKEYAQAAKLFREAIVIHPNHKQALYYLGFMY